MRLTLHEAGWFHDGSVLPRDGGYTYRVGGLPPGEHAKIAEYNHTWRFLRWHDEWHGNWTGDYATPEAALDALREELLKTAA